MTPTVSMNQLDGTASIISMKGWNVRSLVFLGQVEGPEASTKTRLPDLWQLVSPLFASMPDCFSACKATQELPITQLARYVNLFHLVIIDNLRPETLSLPHCLAPSIKPTMHFSQAASLWTWEWQPCILVPNKPFFSTRGMVFIQQYLTFPTQKMGAKTENGGQNFLVL
jgi:hypothetical protein